MDVLSFYTCMWNALELHLSYYFHGQRLESSSKNLPQIYQRFTNHLPMIYQRFTKNKKIFGILLSKYLPRIYQRFTNDLPKTYQRFTKSTKHLPTAYQNIFQFTTDLPTIYQKCLDKNILILLLCIFSKIFSYNQISSFHQNLKY